MKPANIVFTLVLMLMGGFAFMLLDVTKGSAGRSRASATGGSSATLSSALASGKPVLVEFYADWCGACRVVGPTVDEFSREVRDKARVVRLNVDQNRALAQQYRVSALPVFIAIKGGREMSRQEGAIEKSHMRGLLGL